MIHLLRRRARVQRPRPDYEARLAERRALHVVRPIPPAFDWERDAPDLAHPAGPEAVPSFWHFYKAVLRGEE